MKNLKDLSKYYKTNKYELGYIDIYEKYFENIRNKKLNILEIGIDKGPSLRVWSDYFVNSKIAGIDINKVHFTIKNVSIYCGDQSDKVFLNKVINDFKYFDIIIDDGSHISKHIIKSFNFLFDYLNDDGLYIIEDLHYSYYPRYGGSRINLKKKTTSMNFLKSLTDDINYENFNRPFFKKTKFAGKINNINFFQNCVVIRKGTSKKFFYKNKIQETFLEKIKKYLSKIYA